MGPFLDFAFLCQKQSVENSRRSGAFPILFLYVARGYKAQPVCHDFIIRICLSCQFGLGFGRINVPPFRLHVNGGQSVGHFPDETRGPFFVFRARAIAVSVRKEGSQTDLTPADIDSFGGAGTEMKAGFPLFLSFFLICGHFFQNGAAFGYCVRDFQDVFKIRCRDLGIRMEITDHFHICRPGGRCRSFRLSGLMKKGKLIGVRHGCVSRGKKGKNKEPEGKDEVLKERLFCFN